MRGHVGRVLDWFRPGSCGAESGGFMRRPRMVRQIAGGRADDFDGDGRWRRRPSGDWKTGEGGWAGSLEESRAAALVKSSDGLAYAFGWVRFEQMPKGGYSHVKYKYEQIWLRTNLTRRSSTSNN